MQTRHAALVVLVLFALTGCVGGPLGGGSPASPASPTDSPASPTDSPDGTPTDTPVDCTEPTDTPVDPIREDVTPSEYPDRPATWNASSVESYVTAYERAHSRNEMLRPKTKRVTVSVSDVAVEETDRGYRVRLTSRTNTWYGGPTGEDEPTATIVHGDGAFLPVLYEVTDGSLVRAEGGHDDTPTGDEGRVLECWDDE